MTDSEFEYRCTEIAKALYSLVDAMNNELNTDETDINEMAGFIADSEPRTILSYKQYWGLEDSMDSIGEDFFSDATGEF